MPRPVTHEINTVVHLGNTLTGGNKINTMTNRYVCDVLEEIRTAVKVGRIDMIPGLVEEIQTMANRMEAKLSDYSNMGFELHRGQEFLKEVKNLRRQAEDLEMNLEIYK